VTRTFFTDRDLGKQFPHILRDAGLKVERHGDHFAHDAPDAEWLAAVGERQWVVITHDWRIRYKPNELRAVVYNNVSMLVIIGQAPFRDLAVSFVATLPRIEAFLSCRSAPFIAKVYRASPKELRSGGLPSGRIEAWYPLAD